MTKNDKLRKMYDTFGLLDENITNDSIPAALLLPILHRSTA
jgi:hypothetical protein